MSDIKKRMPVIIRKLDAAVDALEELIHLTWDKDYDVPANDSRQKLRTDLLEYSDYLEKAEWWKKCA
ncbi:hypothetical protein SAMN05660653_00164 [Desulfonatronum thiosulfatophilum]|uniref:Uncharacterized protein n=1 Tax=Desulfonatronum thiosulfatophilum TaxID=617002 RepID=A0A1G6A5C5_9BACT|nr:hypothetical protein [Desulfonatronum thiosulfatophilum]SDB03628.1 hypothetical protein SAMN05660653_00164 [Desulfonatronum thiosulfatophilum]